MTDRPILFSAPMVRALLAGTKTQTRRVVKPGRDQKWLSPQLLNRSPRAEFLPNLGVFYHPEGDPLTCVKPPYGVPGDRLWVRETCRAEELSRPPTERPATRKERQAYGRTTVIDLDENDGRDGVRYLADDHWRTIENTPAAGDAWSTLFYYRGRGKGRIGNTVPPIHMPRWASRLTLTITDVRVERLQNISEADAKAEGVEDPSLVPILGAFWSSRDGYARLWEHINGPGSWAANPWVWAVSFEVEAR